MIQLSLESEDYENFIEFYFNNNNNFIYILHFSGISIYF